MKYIVDTKPLESLLRVTSGEYDKCQQVTRILQSLESLDNIIPTKIKEVRINFVLGEDDDEETPTS